MSCEIDQLLCEAWARLGHSILSNPRELKARLARRRSRYFLHHTPRVFCIAIRAADHRIERFASFAPSLRLHPPSPFEGAQHGRGAGGEGAEGAKHAQHTVLLHSDLLRDLSAPVRIPFPGRRAADVARLLGCSHDVLLNMLKDGRIYLNYVKSRRWGRGPSPRVYTTDPLDPCASAKVIPHHLFHPFWHELPGRIPDGISQQVDRTPWIHSFRSHTRFMGWNWLCPSCRKPCRTLYLPIGAPDWAAAHHIRIPADELDAIPQPPPCLACKKCAGILTFDAKSANTLKRSWDLFILHASAGLFFGHEIPIPPSLFPETAKQRRLRQAHQALPTAEELRKLQHSADWYNQR